MPINNAKVHYLIQRLAIAEIDAVVHGSCLCLRTVACAISKEKSFVAKLLIGN